MAIPKTSILDTESGRYMVWSSDDELTKQLLRDGTHEKNTILLAKEIINRSKFKNVLDIGANIGSFAIPIALRADKSTKIYCFEVQRLVWLQLCGNVFLNSLENIYPRNIAVSNKDGLMQIHSITDYSRCQNIGGYSIDSVATSLVQRGDFNQDLLGEKIEVPCNRIDSIHELPPACLVKIDVEGHELEVVEGALEYLERSGWPPIMFEVWGWSWYKEKKEKTFRYFQDIGYESITQYCPLINSNYIAQNKNNRNLKIEINSDYQAVIHYRP
jgi:FkbM family methyltransferase